MDESESTNNGPKLVQARHAAQGIIKSCKIKTAPVMLNDVLTQVRKVFDICVMGVTEDRIGSRIDAVTKRDGSEIYILYNKSRNIHRQRFSFAHELGHLHLGHIHGGSSIDLNSKNFDETEANEFAAHLLMPTVLLRADIKAGIKNASDLAERYNVSEEAMWWQLQRVGLLQLM